MTLTLSRRTLFLALLLLAATIVVLLVLPRSGEKAAQATPLPATATPEPWWHSSGTRRQGEGETGRGDKATPAPRPEQCPELAEGLVEGPHPPATPSPRLLVTHKVQPGDSLSGISKQYDIAVEGLVELNKEKYPGLVDDPGAISVGWELMVR